MDEMEIWMSAYRLVINNNKTEVIHFRSEFSKSINQIDFVRVSTECIHPVDTVRNLGIYLNNTASLSIHICNVCSIDSDGLFRTGRIR